MSTWAAKFLEEAVSSKLTEGMSLVEKATAELQLIPTDKEDKFRKMMAKKGDSIAAMQVKLKALIDAMKEADPDLENADKTALGQDKRVQTYCSALAVSLLCLDYTLSLIHI